MLKYYSFYCSREINKSCRSHHKRCWKGCRNFNQKISDTWVPCRFSLHWLRYYESHKYLCQSLKVCVQVFVTKHCERAPVVIKNTKDAAMIDLLLPVISALVRFALMPFCDTSDTINPRTRAQVLRARSASANVNFFVTFRIIVPVAQTHVAEGSLIMANPSFRDCASKKWGMPKDPWQLGLELHCCFTIGHLDLLSQEYAWSD